MKKRKLKSGDIYPAHVLRDEFGMNAANRPTIHVDETEVPAELRHLIPLVERWAIHCDVTRGDYFDNQPEEDVASFWHHVSPFVDAIRCWIGSQPADVSLWSDAAIHYMYFLKALSEAYQPTEQEIMEREKRQAEWEHQRVSKSAIACGLNAFQQKDYGLVVESLQEFENELDKIALAKLNYARRKLDQKK